MEDALARLCKFRKLRKRAVLILVVMEDALARDEDSLNSWPCC